MPPHCAHSRLEPLPASHSAASSLPRTNKAPLQTTLPSFPGPAHSASRLWPRPSPPRSLGHTLHLPHSWPRLSRALRSLASTQGQSHLSRRPAVPQMTFIFSKRMLLTRPLSMAPGNSASRASSTSRWVRSSSGWRSQEREPRHVTLRFSPGSEVPTLDPLAEPARIPGSI